MTKSNVTPGVLVAHRSVTQATPTIGVLCASLVVAATLCAAPASQAAQAGWPPVANTQGSQPQAPAWFPFAAPAPMMPFGGQPGFSPFSDPMMGFGGFGNMGMMMAPMMGFMAPMMTNYAMASLNPTTMTNFFGMMTNPGGGMMPFGGFGFPGGGFGAPTTPFQFQNQSSMPFPWSGQQTTPWSQPAAPRTYGSAPATKPAFPPFFPFFHQGGTGR